MSDSIYEDALERVSTLLEEARDAGEVEHNAMVVSTMGANGRISSRVVLLKNLDERGFVFYTNKQSLKGQQLAECPTAALVMHWKLLEKQVRVEGAVEGVSDAEADAYFASRARGSQIGAWASHQSRELAGRQEFEDRIAHFEDKFKGAEVPRPPHWSGFRVVPSYIEIWLGREHRLHERWAYQRSETDGWRVANLYP